MANILYENPSHYVIDAGKKGYEVYKNEGNAAVRRASIGRSLGVGRAISEADKRHASEINPQKTVGNTPMPTVGSNQSHGYGHTASQRDGALRLSGNPKAHRIGKR